MSVRWYRDPRSWHFVAVRYLPWLGGFSLLWEVAQLPLYTIWSAPLPQLAFAVAHCTIGDLLIGVAALLLGFLATGATTFSDCKRGRVIIAVTAVTVAYTIFSEWLNTAVRANWEYSGLMPVLQIGAVWVGLSPVAQWILVPPLAFGLARRNA